VSAHAALLLVFGRRRILRLRPSELSCAVFADFSTLVSPADLVTLLISAALGAAVFLILRHPCPERVHSPKYSANLWPAPPCVDKPRWIKLCCIRRYPLRCSLCPFFIKERAPGLVHRARLPASTLSSRRRFVAAFLFLRSLATSPAPFPLKVGQIRSFLMPIRLLAALS